MKQATCRDCGSEIQWRQTKTGKWAPFDLEPRIHFASCKNRPAGRAKVEMSSRELAVAFLLPLGYKKREAERMIAECGEADDPAALVAEALRRAGTPENSLVR